MTLPALGFRRPVATVGRYPLLRVGWRELSLNAESGQTGTLTQTSTVTVTDTYGTTVSVVQAQPPWSYVSGQSRTGLLLGTSRRLEWPLDILPQAMCWMVEFIENGGISVASGGVGYLGNAGATGARVWIESSGTQYQAKYTDGTTTRTVTMTGTAPTSGQLVRLRLILSASGTIQLGQSINGGAETLPAASAATTLPATWGGTTAYLNSVGTANMGNNIYRGWVVTWGNQVASLLQAALA